MAVSWNFGCRFWYFWKFLLPVFVWIFSYFSLPLSQFSFAIFVQRFSLEPFSNFSPFLNKWPFLAIFSAIFLYVFFPGIVNFFANFVSQFPRFSPYIFLLFSSLIFCCYFCFWFPRFFDICSPFIFDCSSFFCTVLTVKLLKIMYN